MEFKKMPIVKVELETCGEQLAKCYIYFIVQVHDEEIGAHKASQIDT